MCAKQLVAQKTHKKAMTTSRSSYHSLFLTMLWTRSSYEQPFGQLQRSAHALKSISSCRVYNEYIIHESMNLILIMSIHHMV